MHPTAASCDPIRMPPPWLHPVEASAKDNGSQATLCAATARPAWMTPASSDPGIDPQIDTIPICPHGNGSQAMGILQPFNAITPEISEKPSAASSDSGSIHAPMEMGSEEGPWWMSLVHNFTPSWVRSTFQNFKFRFSVLFTLATPGPSRSLNDDSHGPCSIP